MSSTHSAVLMEEAQELLVEVPEAPATPSSWRWKAVGSVVVLALVGCAAFAYKTMPAQEPAWTSSVMQTINDWEEIPGIDKVIENAKTLELKQPLRNLNDLFYESQPEELPWIRTECVIDVVQGAAYLGQAVVFLYKAIDYDGLKCPNNSPVGCAASVAGFITSITWIASYLSFAANACGAAVNSGALCAGDWTALMANFGEMATVGAAVKEDCDFNKDWIALLHVTDANPLPPNWQAFVPAGAAPTVETIAKVDALRTSKRNRNFDLTQCVMADVTNAAAYIVRVILQIRSAASACPEPKACAINIMNIISSFAWISQFTALAVSDCWTKGSQKALCAADISDMVAAVTNGPAAGIATTSDCADMPDPVEEEKHLPMD
ncbi:Ultraviolet-B receptor UVR8 [Durusdinium trenchii]|uniref:Ultraviolet-B receptor UVR8 n=1 Tax=Durusdinium trenchii TaxID=1381693 RepID=A0ABP0KWP2_9DINO